ncbi:MAG: acyltransferase [Cohaesibacter sp.]|nr:acyltransferase [Cohaesibacter sp.]
MKSSSGQYYQTLDQVRALAAFLVFCWHFFHFKEGQFSDPLLLPLSFLTEGHTGVAIFMVLSGYLFAKLLDGKKVIWRYFLWNRLIRLAPLLLLVFAIIGIREIYHGASIAAYLQTLISGLVLPVWPNGGWSIAVELHFYLLLPVILSLSRQSNMPLIFALGFFLVFRIVWYFAIENQVQIIGYWTILGRADQFILGLLFYRLRSHFLNKGALVGLVALSFGIFWYGFDWMGGFFKSPFYPSNMMLWIIIPTLEGLTYASVIAYFDAKNIQSNHWLARFIARIGTYSYSIYLLHFFVVFLMPQWIDSYLISLHNPYLILLMALPCFLCMIPFSWASYHFLEAPCLSYRKAYLKQQ